MALKLTMYPALDGDCLLLSWSQFESQHHLLVDVGRGATFKALRPELASFGTLELFVVSHIDADHIAGAMPLVTERVAPFNPIRVWFNGRHQLIASEARRPINEPFGARQGDKLSRGIVRFRWPWNREFASEIVSVDSPEAKEVIILPGGLSIRLLAPRDKNLVDLLPVWEKELEIARLRLADPDDEESGTVGERFESFGPAPNVLKLAMSEYEPDTAKANGSSIAFVAEYANKRVLFAADAPSEILEEALEPLAHEENGRYRIDLLKVSHHGSRANTSPNFVKLIDCARFAISTDGSRKHKHPHPEAIARLLAADPHRKKKLYFNYRQPQTTVWENKRLATKWNYDCVFPVEAEDHPANGKLIIHI